MANYKREYHFRGGHQASENKRFWLLLLIALAIGAAIMYFF